MQVRPTPEPDEEYPALHVQELEPAELLLPVVHTVQDDASAELYVPAAHCEHVVAPLSA